MYIVVLRPFCVQYAKLGRGSRVKCCWGCVTGREGEKCGWLGVYLFIVI
jgi:hypothetical protein